MLNQQNNFGDTIQRRKSDHFINLCYIYIKHKATYLDSSHVVLNGMIKA